MFSYFSCVRVDHFDTKHDLGKALLSLKPRSLGKELLEVKGGAENQVSISLWERKRKGRKEEEERGKNWKSERASVHMSRELKSHRRYKSLEP